MSIYGGGNVYRPPQLKVEIDARGEWAERFRSNFVHVLAERELMASEDEDRTVISFDTDVEFYDCLAKLHHFLFSDGPMPSWVGRAIVYAPDMSRAMTNLSSTGFVKVPKPCEKVHFVALKART